MNILQLLEYPVIELYAESNIYRGIKSNEEEFNINKNLTINDITNIMELNKLTPKILKDRNFFEDMEQLIVALRLFNPELLKIYNLILENYLYKYYEVVTIKAL